MNTDKIATETLEEAEILDAIAPAKTRKQIVAIEQLREAIQNCERAGMSVWCGKKMITGALSDKDGVRLT